eukprot:gene39104-37946_t
MPPGCGTPRSTPRAAVGNAGSAALHSEEDRRRGASALRIAAFLSV